jgi:hypothetical protein
MTPDAGGVSGSASSIRIMLDLEYLSQLDSADRQGEAVPEAKITRLNCGAATRGSTPERSEQ